MQHDETRYDLLINRIKNNKIISLVIVIGTIIISVALVTDSLRSILSLFAKEKKFESNITNESNFDGIWKSGLLEGDIYEWAGYRDRVATYSYRYVFEFDVIGERLFGEVRCLQGELGKIPKEIKERWPILEGKINSTTINFSTKHTGYKLVAPNWDDARWEPYDYMITYSGKVLDDKILFIRQDQRGFPVEKFSARQLP